MGRLSRLRSSTSTCTRRMPSCAARLPCRRRAKVARRRPITDRPSMLQSFFEFWTSLPDYVRSTGWILIVTVSLILSVAFTTLWERKVIGWMQLRKGPNRVGSIFGMVPGIFQPFADVIKLLLKEVVLPENANKLLFRIAPAITLIPAFATWAIIPISPDMTIAKIDAGLLFLLSLT